MFRRYLIALCALLVLALGGVTATRSFAEKPVKAPVTLHSHAHVQEYDVECTVCRRRCCSPCLAGGDITRCAQTRFRECSICGHRSDLHHGVPH